MIYIHIPFCKQICSYCDFYHSTSLVQIDQMVKAIDQELHRRVGEILTAPKTLYFGGGTPSLCLPDQIGGLIETVKKLWGVTPFDELTLEANPEDLTPDYLAQLRAVGVNRLSIGIQSFNDSYLLKMNRRHDSKQAIRAVTGAQNAGFDNITIDLIYGLPWLTTEQWQDDIEQAISLNIQHISAYHLAIEPNTLLERLGTTPATEEQSVMQSKLLRQMLTRNGFEHYELFSFAREGYRSKHNSGYWQGKPYLGVGPSAHSYDGIARRHWNVSSNRLYLQGDQGEAENLTDDELHNEYVMTRLRCVEGFSVAEYKSCFRRELRSVPGLVVTDGRAFISPENFLISDTIISSLFI